MMLGDFENIAGKEEVKESFWLEMVCLKGEEKYLVQIVKTNLEETNSERG